MLCKVIGHTAGIDAAGLLSIRFFNSSSAYKLRCGLMHAQNIACISQLH